MSTLNPVAYFSLAARLKATRQVLGAAIEADPGGRDAAAAAYDPMRHFLAAAEDLVNLACVDLEALEE